MQELVAGGLLSLSCVVGVEAAKDDWSDDLCFATWSVDLKVDVEFVPRSSGFKADDLESIKDCCAVAQTRDD